MKKYLLFAIAIPTLFSSCLKDKNLTDGVYGSLGVEGIKLVQIKQAPEANVIFNVATTPLTETLLTVSTGVDVAEDVTVTLIKDDGLVTTAGYAVLPSTDYTVASLTAVIPKGKRSANILIKLNNSSLLLGTNYALGYKIGSISNSSFIVSENYKTVVCPIIIQNAYAGEYALTTGARYNCGPVGDQGWAPQAGFNFPQPLTIPSFFVAAAIPGTKDGETVNANTVLFYIANLGAGTNRDYLLTINADGSVTPALSPSFVSGISNIRWFKSTYDPVAKQFVLLFTYNNLAGGAGNDRIIYEVLTKK